MKKKNIKKLMGSTMALLMLVTFISTFSSIVTADSNQHTFSLNIGWNYITIPVENDWRAETLAENITGCAAICAWDAEKQIARTYSVGKPYNNFEIENGVGYMVYVTQNSDFTVVGEELSNVSVQMHPGYNLVGYYQDIQTTALVLFTKIDTCEEISMYDSETQKYINYPGANFDIKKGMGLFIKVEEQGTWPPIDPPSNGLILELYRGWNFITIPIDGQYEKAEDLGQAIDGCRAICRFNAETQTFITYSVGIDYNNFDIENGVAYYVYLTKDAFLEVTGEEIDEVEVEIFSRWNFVGCYTLEPVSAETMANSIPGCTTLCHFNSETNSWETYLVGIDYDNFMIQPGEGVQAYSETKGDVWTGYQLE